MKYSDLILLLSIFTSIIYLILSKSYAVKSHIHINKKIISLIYEKINHLQNNAIA